jgi:hypothetical protein
MITLKSKKLHPDVIQEIKGFTMTWSREGTFPVAYKELALVVHLLIYTWVITNK